MTHTPTPWTYDGDNTIYSEQNNTSVCTVEQFCANAGEGQSMTEEEMQANAERIVACVNACEGIENPADFIELAKKLVKELRSVSTTKLWFKESRRIDELHALESGVGRDDDTFFKLVRTHYKDGQGNVILKHEPEVILCYETKPTQDELEHEIMLNDWSRWNQQPLVEDQAIEIGYYTYEDLLGCLPPRIHRRDGYFEVGEPDHHDAQGKPVHRACWKADGKYYTGYPMKDS